MGILKKDKARVFDLQLISKSVAQDVGMVRPATIVGVFEMTKQEFILARGEKND